jgi:hypothetical protein
LKVKAGKNLFDYYTKKNNNNFETPKRQLRLNIMWDNYLIALLIERFFIILLCTFFKAHNYIGFIICMKYNRYNTNNINDSY